MINKQYCSNIIIIARFYSLTIVAVLLLRSDSNSYSLLVGSTCWNRRTDNCKLPAYLATESSKVRYSMETAVFESGIPGIWSRRLAISAISPYNMLIDFLSMSFLVRHQSACHKWTFMIITCDINKI